MPTIAGPPPKVGGKEILSDDYLSRAFSLLSLASLSGCCQVKSFLSTHCPLDVVVSIVCFLFYNTMISSYVIL